MAKFVKVKEAPAEVNKDEYVIDKPNFMAEIEKQTRKAPRGNLVSKFHLRLIVDTIGQNYDPEMTGWVIKTHNYEGRPYADNAALNDIVVEAVAASYPKLFDKYLENKVRNRPAGLNTVYLVESKLYSDPDAILQANGLDSEVPAAKSGKTVGKPAVTKEQAEQLKNKV